MQDSLGMAGQFLQGGKTQLRCGHLHQLHLVELMLADHAAGIASGSTRLGPKTWRECRKPKRQLPWVENLLGHQVGQGYLACGQQITGFFATDRKEVFCKARQLTSPIKRLFMQQIGHMAFPIPMQGCVHIQHELAQRPMQTRHMALQYHEARPGHARGTFEIHAAVERAQGHMIPWRPRNTLPCRDTLLAPQPADHIGRFIQPLGHALMGQVGQHEQESLAILLGCHQLCFHAVQLACQRLSLSQQSRDIPAPGLGLPHGLGHLMPPGPQLFHGHLHLLAPLFQLLPTRQIEHMATALQRSGYRFWVAPQQGHVKHACSPCSCWTHPFGPHHPP